jgi:hypothetical protein
MIEDQIKLIEVNVLFYWILHELTLKLQETTLENFHYPRFEAFFSNSFDVQISREKI